MSAGFTWARVDAALYRDHANGALHGGVDHRDDAVCGNAFALERGAGRRHLEAAETGERRFGGDTREREVGVGDRRLLAAAPVAGGAGDCARALGADDEGCASRLRS